MDDNGETYREDDTTLYLEYDGREIEAVAVYEHEGIKTIVFHWDYCELTLEEFKRASDFINKRILDE